MDSKLYRAAISCDFQVLEEYKGKLADQVTPMKDSVLHVASENGKTKCVDKILLIDRTLLHEVNSREETALHPAVRAGHLDVVKALLCHAQTHNAEEIESGRSEGGSSTVNMLGRANVEGETALHKAVRYNRIDIVRELVTVDRQIRLARRIDLEHSHQANKADETPLYLAARRGYHW